MPDITMCSGGECPLRKKCWRYAAPADQYQAWMEPPTEDGKCEYYYPLVEGLPIGDKIDLAEE